MPHTDPYKIQGPRVYHSLASFCLSFSPSRTVESIRHDELVFEVTIRVVADTGHSNY